MNQPHLFLLCSALPCSALPSLSEPSDSGLPPHAAAARLHTRLAAGRRDLGLFRSEEEEEEEESAMAREGRLWAFEQDGNH